MTTAVTVAAPGSAVSTAVAAAQVPATVGHGAAPVAPSAGLPAQAPAQGLSALPPDVGVTIAEEDRGIFASFWSAMRGHGVKVLADGARWYYRWAKEEQDREERWAKADAHETREALKAEWGASFDSNLKAIEGYLDGLPTAVEHALLNAEIPGGTRLINTPVGANWLLAVAKGTASAGQHHAAGPSLEAEKAEIVALMAKPGSAYYRGPLAEIYQARYREILAGTARPLTQTDLLRKEKASIVQMMGDRGSDYWRGPKSEQLKARYRELLRILGDT